jgi:hypothetical protein
MEGKEFEVIGKSDEHDAWLVNVPKYTGRYIYYVDCDEILETKDFNSYCPRCHNLSRAWSSDECIQCDRQHPETPDKHYDNTNGSLYKFAEDHGLNAYEFDCIKRIVRCRKKGHFREDLEKTVRVINLYLKEYEPLRDNKSNDASR